MSKITFPPAGRAAGALLPGGPERGWRTHLYWYVDAALARLVAVAERSSVLGK